MIVRREFEFKMKLQISKTIRDCEKFGQFNHRRGKMGQRKIEDLTAELIRLPKRDRLEIVRFLFFLDNLSAKSDEIDAAWDEEIAERVRAVNEGTAVGIDYDKAMQEVNQCFFH